MSFLLPAIGLGVGGIASLFRGRGPDPVALQRQLFQQSLADLTRAFEPARAALVQQALSSGAAVGQNLAGSLGRVGASQTGAGRAALALGQTLGPQAAAQSEADFRQRLIQLAMGQAQGMLPGAFAREAQPSGIENLLGFLAEALSGGGLGGLFQQPGAAGGGAAGGGLDINRLMQSLSFLRR